MRSVTMPANNKVSVGWQVVFQFLPVVNFWSFYRIRKLKKFLLYLIMPFLVISVITGVVLGVWAAFVDVASQDEFRADSALTQTIVYNAIGFAFTGLAIYMVVKWSREHNKQFEQPTG